MHKSVKSVSAISLVAFAVVSVIALVASTSYSLAKNDADAEKSVKQVKVVKEVKVNVKQEAKNFEKAERKSMAEPKESQTPGKSNATLHKVTITEVSTDLEEVVEAEKKKKKVKVAQEIEEVITESEAITEDVVEAITEVESRNKFKQFLIGSDYDNLGGLRSDLVKNESQIRKLTRTLENVSGEEQVVIEEQLLALVQERERVKTIVSDNEEGFSLLGWAFRLMNGYAKGPVDESAEDELKDDVQEAIDAEDESEIEEIEIEEDEQEVEDEQEDVEIEDEEDDEEVEEEL